MDRIPLPLQDRVQAGRGLGELLRAYRGRGDVLVLALPRGGVPVGCELAEASGPRMGDPGGGHGAEPGRHGLI